MSLPAWRARIHSPCAPIRRLALPPVVSDVIAPQRDALTDKSRSKAAKANALDRKARGIEPGFKKGRR
jgi:hypothetical protein